MWKILKTTKIFQHPRITLIEDDVLLPNGTQTKYLKFETTANAVTVICKNEKGEILIQAEYSYPIQKDLFQFPGGAVPLSEDVKEGANRELMEEAGLKSNNLTLLGSYFINNRRSEAKMYCYFANKLEAKSLPGDIEEDIESFWVSEEKLDDMIGRGEIQNCHALASWQLYKTKKTSLI